MFKQVPKAFENALIQMARQEVLDDEIPLNWRVSEHGIFCGSLRIAQFDFDTDPPEDFREKVYEQMERKLNAATTKVDIRAEAEQNNVVCCNCHAELEIIGKGSGSCPVCDRQWWI